jgi:hypothetical protein
MTLGGVAFFASSTAAIFSTIAHTSSNKANALSMQIFQLVNKHATAAPVCDVNEDGNGGINRNTQGSVEEQKYHVMIGLGGAAHGDGNGEPSSSTDRLTTEPIDRDRSYLIPIVMNLG